MQVFWLFIFFMNFPICSFQFAIQFQYFWDQFINALNSSMQTNQKLATNQLDNVNQPRNQAIQPDKIQQKRNCLVRSIGAFLQAIVHFVRLYRYNNQWDFLLLFIGTAFSIGTGFGLPLFAVVAGKTIDAFDQSPQKLADQADTNKNLLLIIGFSMLATGTIAFSSWMYLGERVSMRFREEYLKALVKQQIQYFQGIDEQQIQGKFQQHISNIKEAAGLKAGTLIYIAASFVIAGRIATDNGFFLSLVMIPTLPILGISGFLYGILVHLKYTKLMKHYQKAEQKVRESLGFLRTVKELNGQKYEVQLFQKCLLLVKQKVVKYCALAGFGAGVFSLMQFLVYCLVFWLGSHCVQGTQNCARIDQKQNYSPGDVILIFFAFFVRLDSMQQLFPAFKRIYDGVSSYEKIYKIISRKPLVCCPSSKQENIELDFRKMKLAQITEHIVSNIMKIIRRDDRADQQQSGQIDNGQIINTEQSIKIEFKGVSVFSKTDSTKMVLDDISFLIEKQLTVFNGQVEQKQAILDLILRFYDPDQGQILINGIDIKKVNLFQLRKHIGHLDRNTYIFETTIRQNVAMGNKQITDDMIWAVLQELQIAQTIKLLDDQLYSEVGFQGGKLNQKLKKKIVLARVLIKNPNIMLFKNNYLFPSQEQEYKFHLKIQSCEQRKIMIYTGGNERILKKADQILVLLMGKIQSSGDFYSLREHFQQQINVGQDFQGTNKVADQLYKSTLRSSISLRSSNAAVVNENESLTQVSDVSPQKMVLIQQESHLARYRGLIHRRLFGYLKGNLLIYCIGFFICLISGALYPIFTIFMSDILSDTFQFRRGEVDASSIRQRINDPILSILWIGIASFFVSFLEVFIFSVIAERISQKLRLQTLQKALKLPLNWFQASPLRSAFGISQAIKVDPTIVQNLLTNFYSIIIKNTSSFICGITIAFAYEWRSALLGFIVLPMMMLSGYLSVIFYRDQANLSKRQYIDSASIVTETVLNMKAVHTQNCQELVLQNYKRKLGVPLKKARIRVILCALIFGVSQLLILISYTIMFFFGTKFYRDNQQISTLDLLTVIFAVIWSGWTSGANFIRLPAKKSCQKASSSLFFLLDQTDEQQLQQIEQSKKLRSGIKGSIQFKDVKINFKQMGFYIDKVSFKIEEKDKIAISATTNINIQPIIDLLYRFSQPEQGRIFIDNQNIKDYQLAYLRSSLGVIDEGPVIFEDTLKQNILYNSMGVSDGQLAEACAASNLGSKVDGKEILQWTDIQQDLDMNVDFSLKCIPWSKKQRVVMARTILRQPKIVLVNDSIDNISYIYESSYRQTIRNILRGRTSIYMPHYEQNLQTASAIIVLERQKALQISKYLDLIRNKSLFKRIKRNYLRIDKKD